MALSASARSLLRLQVSLVLDVSVKTLYRYIPAPEQKKLRESPVSVVPETAQQPAREPS